MIPRILFRTVPEVTDEQTEAWWQASVDLTPAWEHITYRDPIDATSFPVAAQFWDACTSGAQRAGLIRLEALIRHGGVYIDSDVELWRPIDSLLQLRGFAAWEDVNTVPDAILGFEAEHPVLPVMLAEAVRKLDQGAWESGPGVTTRNLQGRDDVLLLPPQTCYPYHWNRASKRMHDTRHASGRRNLEQLRRAPYALMAHHWRHSWRES